MAEWNKPHDGQMVTLHGDEQIKEKGTGTVYDMVDNGGHSEIRKMTGLNERHEAFFEFSPPIPDLVCLKDRADIEGRFCAGADSVAGIIAGTYLVKREGNIIEMEIRPLKGWQPVPGKIWVRTWIWKSTITVASDKIVAMKSSWNRKQKLN